MPINVSQNYYGQPDVYNHYYQYTPACWPPPPPRTLYTNPLPRPVYYYPTPAPAPAHPANNSPMIIINNSYAPQSRAQPPASVTAKAKPASVRATLASPRHTPSGHIIPGWSPVSASKHKARKPNLPTPAPPLAPAVEASSSAPPVRSAAYLTPPATPFKECSPLESHAQAQPQPIWTGPQWLPVPVPYFMGTPPHPPTPFPHSQTMVDNGEANAQAASSASVGSDSEQQKEAERNKHINAGGTPHPNGPYGRILASSSQPNRDTQPTPSTNSPTNAQTQQHMPNQRPYTPQGGNDALRSPFTAAQVPASYAQIVNIDPFDQHDRLSLLYSDTDLQFTVPPTAWLREHEQNSPLATTMWNTPLHFVMTAHLIWQNHMLPSRAATLVAQTDDAELARWARELAVESTHLSHVARDALIYRLRANPQLREHLASIEGEIRYQTPEGIRLVAVEGKLTNLRDSYRDMQQAP